MKSYRQHALAACLVVMLCSGCSVSPRPDQRSVAKQPAEPVVAAPRAPEQDAEVDEATLATPPAAAVVQVAQPPAPVSVAPAKAVPAPVAATTLPSQAPRPVTPAEAAVAAPVTPKPAPIRPDAPAKVATPTPKPVTATPAAPKLAPAAAPATVATAPKPIIVDTAEPAVAPTPPPDASTANSLGGNVELVAQGRQKVQADEVSDAVVYFRPSTGGVTLQPGRHTIYTRNKAFDPALLVVQQGSTVAFPNSDPILHNVYSNTPGEAFDFGFYGEGETKSHVFDRAGLVLISCNVHHVMAANVLVLDTPYYTRPDASGRFELKNLPSGLGELVFWHPRGTAQRQAVAIPSTGDINQRLNINRPRLGVARR